RLVRRTRPGSALGEPRSQLVARCHVELAIYVAQVPLDCVLGQEQRLGDAAVAVAARGQLRDPPLARGEGIDAGHRRPAGPRAAGQQLLAGPLLECSRPALVSEVQRAAQRLATIHPPSGPARTPTAARP